MVMVLLSLTLLLIQMPTPENGEELEQTVHQYWQALLSRDKASALKFVHPEDQNNFIYRKDMGVRAWEMTGVEPLSETEAKVTVQLDRTVGGNSFSVPFTEVWQKTESGWKVRVGSLKDAYQRATSAFTSASPKIPPGFTWSPAELRIYQMAKPKRGNMVLRNGTGEPILIQSLEVDSTLFEIVSLPSRIEPHDTARLIVAYLGSDLTENQESLAKLRILQEGESREISIPVIYNYADDVTRWLSRQAPKQQQNPPGMPPQAPPVQPPPSR